MTYASSIKISSETKKERRVLPRFGAWRYVWILSVLNIVLVTGFAVMINQAATSGYLLARLEARTNELLRERQRLEVAWAGSQAAARDGLHLEGFQPASEVVYVGAPERITLK